MKNRTLVVLCFLLTLTLSACGSTPVPEASNPSTTAPSSATAINEGTKEGTAVLQMKIDDTPVTVAWEENASVDALKALCKKEPLVIPMSMYGGFEQVGPIGARLPSDDQQVTTAAGDLVLYSSSRLVVFYGSNAWAYTRLGHITDRDAAGMAELLGNGDVTVTFTLEGAE